MSSMRIGVDLGGTKIEAIAIDASGAELHRKRVPTPCGDYHGTVQAIVGLIADVERELGWKNARVGVGMPGAISPATKMVKNSNSTCLIGKPFDVDLGCALGRGIRTANDANCFALSEAADGAAAGAEIVFGAILGTGVGGGIVVGGRVLNGANAIAGEWGHNPLPWPEPHELPGARCYCGRNGCIETFVSGPGFARDYREETGKKLAAVDIARAAENGDADARDALGRYTLRLAKALATVINVLDPDVIVLGGGMSNVKSLYSEIPEHWKRYVFSDQLQTKIVPAKYGDSSGVRGAAWLWPA